MVNAWGNLPRVEGLLDVGEGQKIWWCELGSPEGIPLVVAHGGPGGGTVPAMAEPYDLDRFRVVMFDQRGCGNSLPHASDPTVPLTANTTQHLVRDMERLRRSRGIDRWIVSGSSWGVALTLAYVCEHPERVRGVLLRGITTCSAEELDWVYRDGANRLLPEAWEAFCSLAPDASTDLVAAYQQALENDSRRQAAALAWCRWELAGALAKPGSELEATLTEPRFAMCFARISTHYAANLGFIDQEALWSTIPTLGHIPATMIQGRFDLCTPPATAWRLHRQWPNSTLHLLDDESHRLEGAAATVRASLDELATRAI
ncbi:putative Proline iminopeptidase [metagenome]|uniref:prolyl aminopeptidase n=1 Tax=metagenome TaxID=256318 RepID=A0A2P2CBQ0_9ZZZZ